MDSKSSLSDDQIAELKEAFSLFDANGDGSISAEELGQVIGKLGADPVSADGLSDMIKEVDMTNSGDIDFTEFLQMMGRQAGDAKAEMSTAFGLFDTDKDGYISASELKSLMTSLGEKVGDGEIASIIAEHDKDNDGKISFLEFKTMFAAS